MSDCAKVGVARAVITRTMIRVTDIVRFTGYLRGTTRGQARLLALPRHRTESSQVCEPGDGVPAPCRGQCGDDSPDPASTRPTNARTGARLIVVTPQQVGLDAQSFAELRAQLSAGAPAAALDLRNVNGARAGRLRERRLGHATMLPQRLERMSAVQNRGDHGVREGLAGI